MKTKISLLLIALFVFTQITVSAQTVFGSLTSGNWGPVSGSVTSGQWETYSNLTNALSSTSPTASTSLPSGTHFALIRTGHTVAFGGAARGCKSILVQNGAKVWAGEATQRRLQIGAGGTGFTYPLIDTVQIDGTLGGPTDGIFLETGVNAQLVKIYGTGTADIQRFRMIGNAGAGNGGALTVNLDMDMNIYQAANYAFSAIYNPNSGDNYVVNIGLGKTLTIKSVDGYFNNNAVGSGTGFGTYTYNINGTLDLTASTQTTNNLTAFSPTAGVMNLNVAGLIKTGAAFNSSPVSPGVANLKIQTGGVFDATLATVMNFTNNTFVTEGTGFIRRTVKADGSKSNFPVSTAFGGNNTATISRDVAAGTSAVYDVNVQNSFNNAPADANLCVNRQWNISLFSGAASASDTIRLSWLTADQAAGFNPAGTVNIMHWNGTSWDYFPATVTGTGTLADPYVAKAFGINSYSPFGITNSGPVAAPVTLLSFNANYNGTSVKLNWNTTNEVDVKKYIIQRSNDGRSFVNIGEVNANNNSFTNSYNYIDASLVSDKLYYRLLSVDLNGSSKYSNIISINTKLKNTLQIYPNPSSQFVTIVLNKSDKQTILNVISNDSKVIKQITLEPGTIQTSIYIGDLTNGNYYLQSSNKSVKAISFIKQ